MTLDLLREYCLSLPAATEEIKWGHDLVFSVGGKMFCVASFDPPFQFSFRVKDEVFDELSQQPGFQPAPYLAKAKWVLATDAEQLGKKVGLVYIRDSYEMIKARLTKKQRLELGI